MAFQFYVSKIQTTHLFFLKLGMTLLEVREERGRWDPPSLRVSQSRGRLEKAAIRPVPRRPSRAHLDSSLSHFPPPPSPVKLQSLFTAGDLFPHSTTGLETSQIFSPAQFLRLFPQPFLLTCWLRRKKTFLQMRWHPHPLLHAARPPSPLCLLWLHFYLTCNSCPSLSAHWLTCPPSKSKQINEHNKAALPTPPLWQLPAPATFLLSLTWKLLQSEPCFPPFSLRVVIYSFLADGTEEVFALWHYRQTHTYTHTRTLTLTPSLATKKPSGHGSFGDRPRVWVSGLP